VADIGEVPAGIFSDPRTGFAVVNGLPNSLQFYDIWQDRFISEVEIAPANAIRRDNDRGALLPAAVVEHARFTGNGQWLVTVDARTSDLGPAESNLKFWHFDDKLQRFDLNVCFHLL
jgi:hypothetical protein